MTLSNKALSLIGLMVICAMAVTGYAAHTAHLAPNYRFFVLFALAVATARLKVKLPGLTGNMAVNLPFLVIAASQLSLLEDLLIALPACAVQCFPAGGGKPKLIQVVFNLSTAAVAVAAANFAGAYFGALAAAGFFVIQTIAVSAIVACTEGGAATRIWSNIAHLSFPFYVLSAGIATIAVSTTTDFNWQILLLCVPVLYAIYRSYESYFRQPALARG